MSTQVPAPLYVHSGVSGFRPIDAEPEEPTSKESKGGLNKPTDQLPVSTTDPTVTINPEGVSAAAESESQSGESSGPIPLRILTWNIWFEVLFKEERTSALIATIKSLDPLPGVCCFQECTAEFELQLQEDDWWKETWAMSKCADQFAITGFAYGTMVFVRRELVEEMGFKAKAWFEPFGVGQNGRGLLTLELAPPRSKYPVLIGSSHLDYTPKIRAAEFTSAISTLSVTPTSVFCGDTNIDTYSELKPLLTARYVDSWLNTHPDFADSPDLREVGVTYGTVGLRGPEMPDHGPPRRLDYVMVRGMKVKKCELVGGEPIPKEEWAMNAEEQDLDLEAYVSDHLGVVVDVELV